MSTSNPKLSIIGHRNWSNNSIGEFSEFISCSSICDKGIMQVKKFATNSQTITNASEYLEILNGPSQDQALLESYDNDRALLQA